MYSETNESLDVTISVIFLHIHIRPSLISGSLKCNKNRALCHSLSMPVYTTVPYILTWKSEESLEKSYNNLDQLFLLSGVCF